MNRPLATPNAFWVSTFLVHPNLLQPATKNIILHHFVSRLWRRWSLEHCLLAPHIYTMSDDQLTYRVCVVGGNAVSAFLSWRLSATNACDVTLVWKSGFEGVSQYGISFRYADTRSHERALRNSITDAHDRSSKFGNERFKPRHGTHPESPRTFTRHTSLTLLQSSDHQKKRPAPREPPSTTSSFASRRYPMSTISPP